MGQGPKGGRLSRPASMGEQGVMTTRVLGDPGHAVSLT